MSAAANSNLGDAIVAASGLAVSIAGRSILSGIDLQLRPGRVTVLIGPNGGGKTTLLRALLGHVRASGGVTWLGRAAGEMVAAGAVASCGVPAAIADV